MKADLKNDRRTQKTKKYLAAALIELIREKGYDAITIQDIIERANVGRSTFYSHYESKEQLLVGNINFQQALIDLPGSSPENYPFGVNLDYLFKHTREHLDLARILARSKSIDIISNHFADICAGQIYQQLKKQLTDRKEHKIAYYKAEAAAGGIIRMLFKWLADGAVIAAEEMITQATLILSTCSYKQV